MLDAEILVAGLTTMVLVWAYAAWQRALLDRFRQRLFSIRDEMFHEAMEGKLRFDDPAYGMMRIMLNSMIYGADRFTFAHFLMIVVFHRALDSKDDEPRSITQNFVECVDAMEDQRRARLYRDYFDKMGTECAFYAQTWTPVLGFIVFWIIAVLPVVIANSVLRSAGSRRLAERYANGAAELGGGVNLPVGLA